MADGAASAIIAISNQCSIPLAETQKELTPLQRMVLQKELKREQEESQSGRGGAPGATTSGGTRLNSAAQGNTVSGETIEYVNEGTD